MNYYELFELEMAPSIDKKALNRKFIALQRQFHPDFHTQMTDSEKHQIEERAALINKAYKVLMNEQELLHHFLTVKGVIGVDEKYDLPADFLMEMMELNEALEEAGEEQSKAMIAEAKEVLMKELEASLGKSEREITDEDLQLLKVGYYKKKYLNRILDRMVD